MNVARLASHVALATAGSTVWLLGINMPAAQPTPILYALAIVPWLVATLSFALAHHVDALEDRRRPPSFSPRAADAIDTPKRRELVR
ncbi:hypothetical protein ACQEVC_45350 [Plantactinospora sp. CA-294935]|uniref:hypothetical protein n=1 Tax=Plantactinospora sp. CA-294935 TaxID=3240012 RepID=UPI003D929E91